METELEAILPMLEPQISEIDCKVKTQVYSPPRNDYRY